MPAKIRTADVGPLKRRRSKKGNNEPEESPEWIAKLRDRVLKEAPNKRQFAEKAGEFVLKLMDLSEASINEAAKAPDAWHAMFQALGSPELLEEIRRSDPLALAFLNGLEARRELLTENGGAWKTEKVAEYLGITPQAVNKRRASRQLLGLTFRKRGILYPGWQFTGEGTLPGLNQVLLDLADHDEWMQNVFFITSNDWLAGSRPMDLLREGKTREVREAAHQFGEHGAA